MILKDFGFVVMHRSLRGVGITGSSKFAPIMPHKLVEALVPRTTTKYIRGTEIKPQDPLVAEKKPRDGYRFNVSKIRRKATAYALLRQSQSFLAFYTVSFPRGCSDNVAYQIWNNVLTGLRKSYGLKSYLWVMERQKNGTVHYHMLTNDYMRIESVNSYVACVIDHYVRGGLLSWGRSSLLKYNGVDVRNVVKYKGQKVPLSPDVIAKKVIDYLSKYMTKDLRIESHRVWHCSRVVSALFVACHIDEVDLCDFLVRLSENGGDYRVIQGDWCNIVITCVVDSYLFQETLQRANERVWQWFCDNGGW